MKYNQQIPNQSPAPSHRGGPSAPGRVAFSTCENSDQPLRSVIVTLWGGGSYDELFRLMPQQIPDGRASVWQFQPEHFRAIARALSGERVARAAPDDAVAQAIAEMAAEIAQVPAENVVFNWECCSAWNDRWPEPSAFAELCARVLGQQHVLMFADFSMKSLISGWDASLLGPAPFAQVGTISGPMSLGFDPAQLTRSETTQLKLLGELSERGAAVIQAMGGTIVFTVDRRAADTPRYQLDLLTVATNTSAPADALLPLGAHRGTVGHAVLNYPNGGQIICSSGHWIELQRLDVSQEAFLRSAEQNYGRAYRARVEQEINAAPEAARGEVLQKLSREYVQQSSPTKLRKG